MTTVTADWSGIIACAVLAYLCGSIPFGLIFSHLGGHGDIRDIGSGNIGATNVLRTGSTKLALATLICDMLKGLVPVLIAWRFGAQAATAAAVGATLGHIFPVWLGFKGGKGVATTLAVLLAIDWHVGVACCATWLIVAALFRMSSLASLLAVAAAPFYAWYLPLLWAPPNVMGGDLQEAELAAVIALLVWIKHHTNIRRLLRGEEPRIGAARHGTAA
jgi:glycerol-3-phosphate acyltransferase PlsY